MACLTSLVTGHFVVDDKIAFVVAAVVVVFSLCFEASETDLLTFYQHVQPVKCKIV